MFKRIAATIIFLLAVSISAWGAKTVFDNGNPSLGIKGTRVTAEFLNAVNNQYHTGLDVDGAGALPYSLDTGAANAYVVTLSPALTQYVTGMPIWFKAANANTGASTIDVNGLGVKAIRKNVSDALVGGEIPQNAIVMVVYDGTNFQLRSASSTNADKLLANGAYRTASNAPGANQIPVADGSGDFNFLGHLRLLNNYGLRIKNAGGTSVNTVYIAADDSIYFGDTGRATTGYVKLNGSTENALQFYTQAGNQRKVWHEGNDGSGSGLDADTVDNKNPGSASGLATTDANNRLAQAANTAWDGTAARSFSPTPGANQVPVTGSSSELVIAGEVRASKLLKGITVLTSGSGNYSPAAGINSILVELVGGGGAGGGAPATAAGQVSVGGGGAAGGYARKFFSGVGGGSFAYSVGAGGTGVSGAAGNNGGNTTFIGPGPLTVTGNGGNGANVLPAAAPPGFVSPPTGGTATNGDFNLTGHRGQGGKGIATNVVIAGGGGNGQLGYAPPEWMITAGGIPGSNAGGYGAGGRGAANTPSQVASIGGDGSGGIIIIYEF